MSTKNVVNKRKFSNIHIVYLHSLSITYIFSCSYLIIWIDKQNKSQEKLNTKKSIFCESKKICFCHQIFHVLSWNHIVGSYVLFCKIQCYFLPFPSIPNIYFDFILYLLVMNCDLFLTYLWQTRNKFFVYNEYDLPDHS